MATRVLVVEDHPDLARLLVEMLTLEGFEVQSCTADFDCLLSPEQWKGIDVAIFDLWLTPPDYAGEPDALRYLRWLKDNYPDVRRIVLSAADIHFIPDGEEISRLAASVFVKGTGSHLGDIVEAIR